LPAEAQPVSGPTPTGGGSLGGGPVGIAPDILPPLPGGPFGLPNPLAPPNALPNGITPAAPLEPTSPLGLPVPGAGITTLQQYDPNAPAILIGSGVTVGEGFTSNANYTSSSQTVSSVTSLSPAVSISADTPRLQGVLGAQVTGDAYVPASHLNQVFGDVYGNGHGTVMPDRLFVDAQTIITQTSTLPGLGFTNPSLLPRTQQTQTYATTVSPYMRQ
jgi:hypothetical protein